ncbi:hypothetical protein [Acinetobacter sp. BY484]|uniref:hypothetical protein n=1 Tax=unclassified Acinetobacter TaxID=196816 RepID=UPI00349F39F6
MTWKQNPQLIVKAKLGPRREHIPDRFDSEFYRPAREHYLGQFPIDYVTEKFPPITQEEANQLPMPDSNRQLEFYLILNGTNVQATDSDLLDHKDQIRVSVEGLPLDLREGNFNTEKVFISNLASKYVKRHSKFKKYGLDCYIRSFSDDFLFCFGPTKNGGVFLHLNRGSDKSINAIQGNIYKLNKYGGIWLKWETDLNNWDKWQEIDSAIWHLLDTWNSAPSSQKSN